MKSAWHYIADVAGDMVMLAVIVFIYYLSKEGPE